MTIKIKDFFKNNWIKIVIIAGVISSFIVVAVKIISSFSEKKVNDQIKTNTDDIKDISKEIKEDEKKADNIDTDVNNDPFSIARKKRNNNG
jgi:hypothetical protein